MICRTGRPERWWTGAVNERPAAITLTKPTLIREQFSAMAALLSVPSAPARADDGRFFLFLIRHARLDGHVTGAETFRSDDNLSSISAAVEMPMCSFATLQCALCVTGWGWGCGGAGCFAIISLCSPPQCRQTEPSCLSACRR